MSGKSVLLKSTNHGSKNFAFILALKGEFRSILLDVVWVDQNLTRGFFPSYFHFLNGALLWDSTRALKRMPAAPCNVLSPHSRRAAPMVIDHFTVVCLVAWPLNESEVGVDLVLIATSQLFLC